MVTFSIICLVVILFAIQHLLNWMWRKMGKMEDNGAFIIMMTLVGGIVSWVIICQIIEWGKQI